MSAAPASPPGVRRGSIQAWSAAIRPRSLPVAVAPVLVGASFGFARSGRIDGWAAIGVLAASVLMQVVTNLQNDVGYTLRGGDASGTRTGWPRATSEGWLGIGQTHAAIAIAAAAAAAIGLALAAYRGWPVLAIGTASLVAALAYMAGPRPIAYTPFGELTVFVFFGLVAVTGTDWVLTGVAGADTLVAGCAVGSLAAAALAANNHRDRAHDRLVGRRTFAVCWGPRVSTAFFTLLLWLPFALLPALAWLAAAPARMLPLLLCPLAWRLRRDFVACAPGAALNAIVLRTFRLGLQFAALLSFGALWPALQR